MRRCFAVAILVILSAVPVSLIAQQSAQTATAPTRDPQAVAVLQQSFAAMGKTLPSDSTATGEVVIVAGTKTDSGTIRILTRGTDQSFEQIQLPDATDSVTYSHGHAQESAGGSAKPSSRELAASSQCPDFPLPLLMDAFNNPDVSFQYVGEETLDGSQAQHIRFWNTFASKPAPQIPSNVSQTMPKFMADVIAQGPRALTEFTVKDLWLDGTSGLPRELAYERRDGRGAVPHIRMEVTYSNWQSTSGVPYPYQIVKSMNGTPWTTITIQSLSIQTGLTDNDFQVQMPAALAKAGGKL